MKITSLLSKWATFRNFHRTLALTLGMSLGTGAWGAPTLQSIEVLPNPLVAGQTFTIAATASPDVTIATATVDFRPGATRLLRIPLIRQGVVWSGSGALPTDLQLPPGAGANVKVILLDSGRNRTEGLVNVNVTVPSSTAVFAGGILAVTGDDQDNTLTVSRDAAGTLLVNNGALPVTGGVATVANTALIRIFGLKGNDVLLVDDANGAMPRSNVIGGEGDDTLTGSANVDELDGGPGNDSLHGRDGADRLIGGAGNDLLDGGRGDDQIFGGEGDDQMVWNPGDGSDLLEGEAGEDTMLFNGSNAGEAIDIAASAQRLRFFRNVGNITMDCAGVERVIFRALGGADVVTVHDLSETEVTQVGVDLSGSTPGIGDGQADTIVVEGTEAADQITVSGSAPLVDIFGLTAAVTVFGAEEGVDELIVNALGGDDLVDASTLKSGAIELTLNGGNGTDVLMGGEGDDLLIGVQGNDTLLGGPGDDTFVWNPGDGSDVVEGQGGLDTLVFNGSNVGENMDLSANGARLRLFRNVGNITMDCAGISLIEIAALGGADAIVVNDLSGTGVTGVNLDLASPQGSNTGDGQADNVIVNGTDGADAVTVARNASGVSVAGLVATVTIAGSEPALDRLTIRALGGDDVVEASGLGASLIALTADGGMGDDVLIGSAGADVLIGGPGDDVLLGGAGVDLLDGGPGNNIVIQD